MSSLPASRCLCYKRHTSGELPGDTGREIPAGEALHQGNGRLADQDDLEIELVGLCTDICVVSNALMLKAYLPEAKISVDPKCCAGVTPEE